ncbi:hypothetical protein EUX98_g3323 [Antrodiella citrinella]|uniref:G-protein coupled receptors family 1 profile domain-containing protein n=1 Tax=Antrodiella citrinella TaxID=2447956 RepID=A0A4S4N514_9APHY|nr:hypothetical protein EUX98_g3323 [Antrodiella citrinella]
MVVLDNDLAALIGFGCEALVYGVYIVIFLMSLSFLHGGRSTYAHRLMVFSTTFLFLLCTAHFALEFTHFYTTLATTGVTGYAAETKDLFGADILISTIDLVGDCVLLHRCWLVWGKNWWVIALPFLTAVGGFACGMTGLGILLNTDPTAPQAPPSVLPLGTASFSLPLATNFLITLLTVTRLYMLASKTRRASTTTKSLHTSSYVNKAAIIVIESGLLYLVAQLVFVILFAIGHPAQGIAAVVAVQIYGIAPTLISFRVGMGVATDEYEMSTKRSGPEWRLSSRRGAIPTNTTNISVHTSAEIMTDSLSDMVLYGKDNKDMRLGDHQGFTESRFVEDGASMA